MNGMWSPICAHWFWNNNIGATLFCKKLDPKKYRFGKWKKSNQKLESDAVRVGACRRNDKWLKCTGGCNDLGKGDRKCNLWSVAKCARGNFAKLEISCNWFNKL